MKAGVAFGFVLPAARCCASRSARARLSGAPRPAHYLAFATLGSTCSSISSSATRSGSQEALRISGIRRPTLFGLSLDGSAPFSISLRGDDRAGAPICLADPLALGPGVRALRDNRSAPRASASTSSPTRCSRSRSARPAPDRRSLLRRAGAVHRSVTVPPHRVADDVADGDRRRAGRFFGPCSAPRWSSCCLNGCAS